MAQVNTQVQTLGGQRPGDVLRLSAAAQAAPAAAQPASPAPDQLRLLSYRDKLTLSAQAKAQAQAAAQPAPQAAAPATAQPVARVQQVGLRARATASAAPPTQATTPIVATVTTPATQPAPAAQPQPAPTVVTQSAPAAAPQPTPAPADTQPDAYAPETDLAKVAQPIAEAPDDSAAFKAAETLLADELKKRQEEPATEPEKPKTEDKPADEDAKARLKNLEPEELARLGEDDKDGFFSVLRPAAEEAEREYGVPAAVTLAQAALETGWGKHIIPGYNIFGIKGEGPAGTVAKGTWEVYDGETVTITANFAKFYNFYEAVSEHGKLFHNGYYDKAMDQFAEDHDPFAFARNITGTYATDPAYGSKLSSIMRDYGLA